MSFELPGPGVVLGIASLVLKENATIDHALDVVHAAVDAGVLAIDTARAYATVDDDAAGERIAQAAREQSPGIPIITKAGHFRLGRKAWDSDASAERVRADALRSREVLGAPPSLLLLHRADRVDDLDAPVRELAALRDEGVVEAIGLSNATIEQLDQARAINELDAVENRFALGIDRATEYRYCVDAGIPFLAYAPFGGPKADPLATHVPRVAALARARGVSVHRAALAAMLDAMPGAWPVIGSTRVESVLDSIAAADLEVDDDLRRAFADDLRSRGVGL
ncbi:aldo/keto reductase [Agromyces aurantiacus]|uniref:Aldo/keto reductase n=1 Tax=Agromyces aurantiacus TaxID=165814 RepID=A0ABV9R5K6_9MICO|nr:aldo/keto reductase [Agromyces aurantiacus]MBM7503585.1 aryl-alcohol dehydrogenase-like predicted oxidoreductase [Agromyces aurantiacus]